MNELPDLVDIYAGMICADVLRYQHKGLEDSIDGSEFVDRIRKHIKEIFELAYIRGSASKVNQQ